MTLWVIENHVNQVHFNFSQSFIVHFYLYCFLMVKVNLKKYNKTNIELYEYFRVGIKRYSRSFIRMQRNN